MINQVCLNSVLLESAKEVFETMIFMDLDECLDSEQNIENDNLLSSITFKGDVNGCLTIRCGYNCAKSIGTNMLGMEPDDEISTEEIYDALGEVANMVMGSVKTRIQDDIGDINVSIPMVMSGKEIQTNLSDKNAQKSFIKVVIDSEYVAEFTLLYKENI